MELKTIIIILELILLGCFGMGIFGITLAVMFIIAEKIQDWRS